MEKSTNTNIEDNLSFFLKGKTMKRYLVTVDTIKCTGEYEEEYRTRIGLIGAFDSLSEATIAKTSIEKKWPMLELGDPDDPDEMTAISIREIDSDSLSQALKIAINSVYGLASAKWQLYRYISASKLLYWRIL